MMSRMTIYHNRVDPYDGDEVVFECMGCGHRVDAGVRAASCPSCGGDQLRNLSVPQE